ncbi:cellobiose transport system permease protein [Catenuloplanes nepalensis]|uniref:Cellobiose transport system permease protein n=1 Tax=Catenuloplanes nepalensis TaxID=587533 RepID=A0ABT9N070_9ACTN|nr:sugar ABC transporter permease [Catenuloplanes nepalensis]MDP9796893.1 cellobiose transport system permease protein [Catenuloplanes nepalensis]
MSIDTHAADAPRHSAGPPPLDPGERRKQARQVRRGRLDMKASPYLYVAPFFVLFAVFGFFPLLYTGWVSMRDWGLIKGDQGFVGLQNFQAVLTDANFWNAMYNTAGIFVVATVPQLLLALMLANWLNRKLRFRTALRMGILLPNITSVAAVGIVFGFIFADRYGLANWILQSLSLDPISWRGSRFASWTAIAFMVDWRWTGYNALIYLAAMQAIPRDLYESASLDGASPTRQFWQLTVPLIQPTILFTVIISTIGGMQLFTEPLMFNYGAAGSGSGLENFQTIAMYIYYTTFEGNFKYGLGSAMSWLLFLLIIGFALINFLMVRRSLKGSK